VLCGRALQPVDDADNCEAMVKACHLISEKKHEEALKVLESLNEFWAHILAAKVHF
jgi:hypothetical protein